MKAIVCEMCGSRDFIKQNGVYVCQNCETKYTPEEAKKLMVEVHINETKGAPITEDTGISLSTEKQIEGSVVLQKDSSIQETTDEMKNNNSKNTPFISSGDIKQATIGAISKSDIKQTALAVFLIPVIILFIGVVGAIFFSGQNREETAIKDKCEEIMEGVYESSAEEWASNGFNYSHSKPKTTVDYDKENGKFTCSVSVEQKITLQGTSEVTNFDNNVVFYGHIDDTGSVIIDNFKSN